jgi:hypothetical protein
MEIRRIAVYCGSRFGSRAIYRSAAQELGAYLGEHGISLVYGGGGLGLMGEVASATLASGGTVVGVIPEHLVGAAGCLAGVDQQVVNSMHERKALMASSVDAFLVLPGGLGTMDELFEIATWQNLKLHAKPIGVWDLEGFFDPLHRLLDRMVEEGFLELQDRNVVLFDRELESLFYQFREFGERTQLPLKR